MPKDWFHRTDKRNFQVQLSEIERRQARLSMIRANLANPSDMLTRTGPISTMTTIESQGSPNSRYLIGLTQKSPVDLLDFARDPGISYTDPYVKVIYYSEWVLPPPADFAGLRTPSPT